MQMRGQSAGGRVMGKIGSELRRLRSRAVAVLVVLIGAAAVGLFAPTAARANHLPYHDPSLPIPTRVNDLLGRMSLDEKIGQMTQAERNAASTAQITQFRLG